MARGPFQLRVITPEKVLFDQRVNKLRFPGLDGLYGVLPGHAPLITGVDSGRLDAETEAGEALSLFVAGGFAQIDRVSASIVCNSAEDLDDIDTERAARAAERARQRLKAAAHDRDIDVLRAEFALRRALMRLRIRKQHLA